MTKEQKEAIERLKELRDSYELHQSGWANRCLDITENYVKNSVHKELYNKILGDLVKADRKNIENNEMIDLLVGEVAGLNYECIGEWCRQEKCEKFKKTKKVELPSGGIYIYKDECDTNNFDCIKEYFKELATKMLQKGE